MSHILKHRIKHRDRKPKRRFFAVLRAKPEREPKCEPEKIEPVEIEPVDEMPEIKERKTGLACRVTTITANFKTPGLTFDAVTSFKEFYPDVPYILIDNGGCLKSLALGRRMAAKDWVHFVSNSKNIGHGLALNQGLAMTETPYAFLLDSDTKTERGGFLEKMLAEFDDRGTFAVGWLRRVNKSGVAYLHNQRSGYPYVHPYACLLNVEKFHSLCPFVDTNAPAISLMRMAIATGLRLVSFPVEDYIWHKIAGTRGMFGGNCHPKTDVKPREWHARRI